MNNARLDLTSIGDNMAIIRPKINSVFTPRNPTVNPAMYVKRPSYERELQRAIEGSLHAILCGESGSGKTWLYRHVASQQNWKTYFSNAGNAARYNNLTTTIAFSVTEDSDKELAEYTRKTEGEADAIFYKGTLAAESKFTVKQQEALLKAFKVAREKAGDRQVVLVIDNLEAIFGKASLMEELGQIIILLDDPDYAKYNVKILIVGVPSGIVEYFQKIENMETVADRLSEVSSITGLHWGQIEDFIERGFNGQLKLSLHKAVVEEIARHVEQVTLGIAQRIHEYCEILAFNIEDSGWVYEPSLLAVSDNRYLNSCIKKAYSVVDGRMNERNTKTGRRNQILYSLGRVNKSEFDATQVEELVRQQFPQSTQNITLGVGQMLADLASGTAPVLRRASKSATYRFADPRYLMAIRVMLRKSEDGQKVIKATFRH